MRIERYPCIKQRGELLTYAVALTRNLPDAEDAVSHVVQKIYEHYVRHGTVCPKGRDAVAGVDPQWNRHGR